MDETDQTAIVLILPPLGEHATMRTIWPHIGVPGEFATTKPRLQGLKFVQFGHRGKFHRKRQPIRIVVGGIIGSGPLARRSEWRAEGQLNFLNS